MKYNFDKVINRKNTDCYKWDTTKDGVIPMWVADMDFEVAKPIVDSIIKRANHRVFGYTIVPNEYFEAEINWWKKIFSEFAAVAKKDSEGFVDYVWPKPGFEAPQLKVSFVKLFKPFNWVIGTGEYVDDVTTKLQAEALKTIGDMRYANNDYFWINDSSPKMIMHPVSKHLDGKDLSAIVDAKGKKLFIEMAKVSNEKKTGGLVKYWWDKPEKKNDPKEKFSYVQKFEPWDWIIGTEAYVDDIEQDVVLMEEKTSEEITSVIISILLFAFISIIIVS